MEVVHQMKTLHSPENVQKHNPQSILQIFFINEQTITEEKRSLTFLAFIAQNLGLLARCCFGFFFFPSSHESKRVGQDQVLQCEAAAPGDIVGLNTEWAEFTDSSAGGQFRRQRCCNIIIISHAWNIHLIDVVGETETLETPYP